MLWRLHGMLRAPLLWRPRLGSAPAKQRRPLHVHQIERGQVSLASPADGVKIPHARPPKVIRNGPIPLATFVVDQWAPHEGIVLHRLPWGALLVDVGCEVPGMLPADGYFASNADELDQLSPGDCVTCYACCKYPASWMSFINVSSSCEKLCTPCAYRHIFSGKYCRHSNRKATRAHTHRDAHLTCMSPPPRLQTKWS